jgi:hypothetical protein
MHNSCDYSRFISCYHSRFVTPVSTTSYYLARVYETGIGQEKLQPHKAVSAKSIVHNSCDLQGLRRVAP